MVPEISLRKQTAKVIEKEAPGLVETIRRHGRERTPYAMLSRELAGIRGKTVIINLPGSSKGAQESMEALFPGLLHAFPMLWGGGHDEGKTLGKTMISIKQALEIIKANLPERKTVVVPTSDALGYVLAEKVQATVSSPPYTNSAVDGFAISWRDVGNVKANKPVVFSVAGESSAGFPVTDKIMPHCAYRISTGAIVPDGLDTVIPLNTVKSMVIWSVFLKTGKQYQNVRFAGEEFRQGEELLTFGNSDRIGTTGFNCYARHQSC